MWSVGRRLQQVSDADQEDDMLRGLSNVRRRVEQLATQAGSGRCSGYHLIHRGPVQVSNDNPPPRFLFLL